jgi:hypothetical protein
MGGGARVSPLQGLEHSGILAVRDYKQHAYGPALFHYEAQAVPDHS